VESKSVANEQSKSTQFTKTQEKLIFEAEKTVQFQWQGCLSVQNHVPQTPQIACKRLKQFDEHVFPTLKIMGFGNIIRGKYIVAKESRSVQQESIAQNILTNS
jgi:hypothetical protein